MAARDDKADKAVLCEQKKGNAGKNEQSLQFGPETQRSTFEVGFSDVVIEHHL